MKGGMNIITNPREINEKRNQQLSSINSKNNRQISETQLTKTDKEIENVITPYT